MIDDIYRIIRNETDETNESSKKSKYIVTTYRDFLDITDTKDIVIVDKSSEVYYKNKVKNQLWRKMEDLLGYIQYDRNVISYKNTSTDKVIFYTEYLKLDVVEKKNIRLLMK